MTISFSTLEIPGKDVDRMAVNLLEQLPVSIANLQSQNRFEISCTPDQVDDVMNILANEAIN